MEYNRNSSPPVSPIRRVAFNMLREALSRKGPCARTANTLSDCRYVAFRLLEAIEYLLRHLCEEFNIDVWPDSLYHMIKVLRDAEVLPTQLAEQLSDFILLHNMIVHEQEQFDMDEGDVALIRDRALTLFRWYLCEFEGGPALESAEADKVLPEHKPRKPGQRRVFLCYAKE